MKAKKFSLPAKIVSILYIILITMFAFEVPLLSAAFIIHLIPTVIFTAILIAAWIKPQIGGIAFIIAGILTIIFFHTYREIITLFSISLIPIVVGILFILSDKKH